MADPAHAVAKAATEPYPSPTIADSFRPARALVGWMAPDEAHAALAQGHDGGVTDAITERARKARMVVSSRSPYDERGVVIGGPPVGLAEHFSAFRQTAQNLFDEDWQLCEVDLTKTIALQPVTFRDHYAREIAAVATGDLLAIARIALPLPREIQLPVKL